MKTEGERFSMFTRRAFLIAGAQGALATVLMGRMYYLGVVEADKFQLQAEENRIGIRFTAPDRGEIVDRAGRLLATNHQDYRVFIIPEQADGVAETLKSLGRIIDLPERRIRRIRQQIRRKRSFIPTTVAQNLSWKDFSRINVELPNLPGVQPDAGKTRHYPEGKVVSHVVGYVGPVSEEEMTDEPIMQLPGFKIGKTGLERQFESKLRGGVGNRRVEVNAYGREIRELENVEGPPGESIQLTIDLDLQRHVVELLGEESAAVVVMDVHTGDILSLASTPAFNSNDFNIGISSENWASLQVDPRKPLLNKVLQGQYSPASTFKMIVALAALEAGVAFPTEKLFCNGKHTFGNQDFHCWKKEGHGRVDLQKAIAQSCDVYFYEVAVRVGIEKIAKKAREFGLGEVYPLGLGAQQKGLIPDNDWKRATYGEPWQKGETVIVGIGQGAVLTTPLQLAVMTARLANGGIAVNPRLVHKVGDDIIPRNEPAKINQNPKDLELIQRAMEMVFEQRGTAYGARLRRSKEKFAGKTGTSQVRRITKQEREEGLENRSKKPWKERDHALFVGYAPADNPRYAVSILIEHGVSGGGVAAPYGSNILGKTLELDPSTRIELDSSPNQDGEKTLPIETPKKTGEF
jgi:penicillin-binding protein 2